MDIWDELEKIVDLPDLTQNTHKLIRLRWSLHQQCHLEPPKLRPKNFLLIVLSIWIKFFHSSCPYKFCQFWQLKFAYLIASKIPFNCLKGKSPPWVGNEGLYGTLKKNCLLGF